MDRPEFEIQKEMAGNLKLGRPKLALNSKPETFCCLDRGWSAGGLCLG